MLFSYGFIEAASRDAKSLFLDLSMPHDDPLWRAKLAVSSAVPGVRIFEAGGSTSWESDLIWLICTNEEDGLELRVRQTIDGAQELAVFWKENELEDTSSLGNLLENEPLWPVYQLRAACLILDRVVSQLESLEQGTRQVDGMEPFGNIREGPEAQALKLRELEYDLLTQSRRFLEGQVSWVVSNTER